MVKGDSRRGIPRVSRHNRRLESPPINNFLSGRLGRRRLDQHVQPIIRSKTDLVPGQSNNARIAGSKHLDLRPAAQPKLLQPVNVVGLPQNVNNMGTTPGRKAVERNDLGRFFHQRCSWAKDRQKDTFSRSANLLPKLYDVLPRMARPF